MASLVHRDGFSRFDRIAGLLIVVPAILLAAASFAAGAMGGVGIGAILFVLGIGSMAGVRILWVFVALLAGVLAYSALAAQMEPPISEREAAVLIATNALMMFIVIPGIWFALRGFGVIRPSANPERTENPS